MSSSHLFGVTSPATKTQVAAPQSTNGETNSARQGRDLWRLCCTPVLPVLVGPTEKSFFIHRGLLRQYSDIFRMLLNNGQFRESQEDVVRLPEDDPLAFACFVEWLYNQDVADTGRTFKNAFTRDLASDDTLAGFIDCGQEGYDTGNRKMKADDVKQDVKSNPSDAVDSSKASGKPWSPPENSEGYDFSLQFSCYVLGDKLQSAGFTDHIMNEILYKGADRRANLTVEQVIYVYTYTTKPNDN